jgi:hypothetical protein
MTESQAERFANLAIGVAAVGAAVCILKTPALRRLAWGLTRTALTISGPAWLIAEARRGWDQGALAPPTGRDMIGG